MPAKNVNITDLKNIVVPSELVDIGDQQFRVTGLPLHKLLTLFESHIEYLDEIVEGDTGVLAIMLQESPDLVAKLIAEANGSPEDWEVVATFPSQVQLKAVAVVINLTFPDKELLGKWSRRLEVLVEKALVRATSYIEHSRKPSSEPSNGSTPTDIQSQNDTP